MSLHFNSLMFFFLCLLSARIIGFPNCWMAYWKYFFLLSLHLSFLKSMPILFIYSFIFGFSRQGFSVALEPGLELTLVDQAGLKLTKIHLPQWILSAGIKSVYHHHHLALLVSFIYFCQAQHFSLLSLPASPLLFNPLPRFPCSKEILSFSTTHVD